MSTEKRQEYIRQWQRNYKHTIKGKAQVLWDGLSRRAENKIGCRPTYKDVKVCFTKEEFLAWVIPNLEEWVKSHSLESVTVDRKDSKGHYELSNVQLLTKSDNSRKLERNKNVVAPVGFAWCGKCEDYLTADNFFHNSNNTHTGTSFYCKMHSKEYTKKYRKSI